jgi:sugar lactone lactonase YvrE
MAIKIAGTTVVDDSRGLTNIATVDATTAAAISAAGVGGGGEHDFVASGAITNGDVVGLNADGTVSVVAETNVPDSAGSAVVFESASVVHTSATYDSINKKVIIVYRDGGNSYYGTAVVGTVSESTISFGTPVVFESANSLFNSAVYDANAQKVVIAYRDGGNSYYGTAIVGTVSGTSISFGSPTVFESARTDFISIVYDANAQKVVIAYQDDGNSSYGTAIVGTVSGTSISFGSAAVFESADTPNISATFDSTTQKVVIAYTDAGNSYHGTAIVGTVSGTSISFGSAVVFENSETSSYISAVYDDNAQKVVIAYRNDGNSSYGTAVVGTVSGTSISFGTPVVFDGGTNAFYVAAAYNADAQSVVIAYKDTGNNNYGTAIVGTVSGSSISFGSPVVVVGSNFSYISAVYDANAQKVVIAYEDESNSSYGTAVVFTNAYTSTNASSYIGVAAEDISDTATGAVTIDGGVNEQTVNSYDLANASYDSVSFSVSAQEGNPKSISFKPDGTKMFVVGATGSDINEYNLSSAWDVSSSSYVQNFSVSAQIGQVGGAVFKPDGTKVYITDINGDDVNEYDLSTAWDISTASYTQNFSIASQGTAPWSVFFKTDGTKMYFIDSTNDVYEYNLSTAWNISTASYVQGLDVSSVLSFSTCLFFTPDGTKMFLAGQSFRNVSEYNLSTAWDISTASYIRNFNVISQEFYPNALTFGNNGTKMYVVGSQTDTIYQYSTGTFGGYTINVSQFVADDGSLTTTNNGRKIARSISTTELLIDSAMTGDETNEYLGSLV